MIDVTIKTLDSRTRSFSVPEQITVKEFKERISSSVEIAAETQRLIFRGRVLQNDKKLNDYDVHGQTIHLVEKPPPSSRPPPSPPHPPGAHSGEGGQGRDGNSFFVGAITLPAEVTEARDVQRNVQQVVSDMGEVGRNARVTSRVSPDGSSVDVHINLGSINIPQVSESQQRINHIKKLLRQANQVLEKLETPPHMYYQFADNPQQAGTQTDPPDDDMDTAPEAATTSTANSDASEPPGALGGATTEGGGSSSTGSRSSSTGSGSSGRRNWRRGETGPVHPPALVMADVLRDVNQLNTRLQPHLDRYQRLLREDPSYPADELAHHQEAQRLQNMTQQVLHIISHIYHSVSDCTIDLHRAPPRTINAAPVLPVPPMGMAGPPGFGGLPMPVQVNIGPAGSTTNRSSSTSRNTPPTSSAQQQSTPASTSQASSSAPSTSSSASSTVNSSTVPGSGRGQAASTQNQPTIQVTNSQTMYVIRPNGQGENQSAPGGGSGGRSFTIRGPAGVTIRAPGGASFRAGMPPNQGGPGGPGIVRGPHIQIRHVQMPGGQGGQGVPLPPQVMQGLVSTLIAQAQQQAQQQAEHHAQGTPPGAPTGQQTPASSSSSTATSSTSTATASTAASTASTAQTTASTQAQTSSVQSTAATTSSTSTSSTWSRPQNPSTSASSTQPTSHASNATGQQQPHILLNPLLQSNAWDPYLNCSSRYTIASRLSGAQNLLGRQARMQAGGSRGTGTQQQGQQGQNDGSVPAGENAFADMIGGLVGALINQPGQFMPHPRPQAATSGNTAGSSGRTNTTTSTTGTSSSSSTSHTQSFTFGPFTGFGGMRSNVTGVQSPMSEEVMAGIMGQISQQFGVANPGGQAVNQSLSDFFRSLGYSPDPSEGMGFLNDLVNMICQNLSMPDLAAIFFGNTAPLQAMRPNMQRFVNERIMRGQAMTPGNIEIAVDRLIEETRPVITSLLQDAVTVNNIDPLASNIAFLRELLMKYITLFVGPCGPSASVSATQEFNNHQDRNQFGEQLLRLVRNGMHEWVCLMIHMFGGREGFHDYMQSLLETLLSLGDHQEMANLAVQVSLSNLETIASTMQVSEDQILQYVVKKDATQNQQGDNVQTDGAGTEQSDQPGSSSAAASSDTTDADKKPHGDETPMDVDSTVPKQNTTSESAQSASTERAFMAAAHSGPARNGRSDVAAAVGGAMAAEPVIPNWQAAVPQEWVPVINQDIVRQRRQAPQAPLSDAYLSGMPTKRLKLTQERNVPVSNGMETYVPETLRRAIQTAGVAPRTSMDVVMQEAKEDQQLHRACEEQVRSAVRERLRRDPDYNPQRFPNAEKYFQNKKKK